MDKKLIGAVCLVAGTAIGAGMFALPMTLAKLGLAPTLLIMIATWLVMYYSALINLELNLRTGSGMPLGALGRFYKGRAAEIVGALCLLLLTYALLSAYLYGGTSILYVMIQNFTGRSFEFSTIMLFYTAGLMGLLAFALHHVEKVNRVLFCALLGLVGIMMIALFKKASLSSLPLLESGISNLSSWTVALPTVFTSFGFQVIFHTLTTYCDKDARRLKKAFFWGSFIPLIVYVLWTLSVLGSLYRGNLALYHEIIKGGVEVGTLMEGLSQIMYGSYLKLLTWIISILAIFTSAIGVSLGLIDTWKHKFKKGQHEIDRVHFGTLCLTLIPPFFVALFVPNAFIKALGFAGMILAIIAILLPIYLLSHALGRPSVAFYPIVKNKSLHIIVAIFGIFIMLSEGINMIFGNS